LEDADNRSGDAAGEATGKPQHRRRQAHPRAAPWSRAGRSGHAERMIEQRGAMRVAPMRHNASGNCHAAARA